MKVGVGATFSPGRLSLLLTSEMQTPPCPLLVATPSPTSEKRLAAFKHHWLAGQVHNVGVHPSVVREDGKLVDDETLENIARLVGKFLEQREPGLQVSSHQVSNYW